MKVQLLRERRGDFYARSTKPVSASLPFFEREGWGYVHRVRSAHMHYDSGGKWTHTSVKFWCGQHGFIHPTGARLPRGQSIARMVLEPSPGRVVCATCQARAHGSGQVGTGKLGDEFVKFTPRADFFARRKGVL